MSAVFLWSSPHPQHYLHLALIDELVHTQQRKHLPSHTLRQTYELVAERNPRPLALDHVTFSIKVRGTNRYFEFDGVLFGGMSHNEHCYTCTRTLRDWQDMTPTPGIKQARRIIAAHIPDVADLVFPADSAEPVPQVTHPTHPTHSQQEEGEGAPKETD